MPCYNIFVDRDVCEEIKNGSTDKVTICSSRFDASSHYTYITLLIYDSFRINIYLLLHAQKIQHCISLFSVLFSGWVSLNVFISAVREVEEHHKYPAKFLKTNKYKHKFVFWAKGVL
jgi:hypothetical protein